MSTATNTVKKQPYDLILQPSSADAHIKLLKFMLRNISLIDAQLVPECPKVTVNIHGPAGRQRDSVLLSGMCYHHHYYIYRSIYLFSLLILL